MASPVDRLRNPAHTGTNRCLPCTAVNVGLAGVAALAVATVSVPLALVGFALAMATIAVRGYLVPGTPQLTARYLPDRVLAWFHDADGSGASVAGPPRGVPGETGTVDSPGSDRSAGVDGTTFLVDAAILTSESREQASQPRERESSAGELEALAGEREAGTDATAHELTADFRACLTRELDRLTQASTLSRTDGEDGDIGSRRRRLLAELFESAPDEVGPADRPYPAVRVGPRVRGWPSPAAHRSDLASHAVLDSWTDRWRERPVDQRVELLETIRSLLERCPDCDGAITIDETPVESCCVDSTVATHQCSSCGARLLEFDPDRAAVHSDRRGGLE